MENTTPTPPTQEESTSNDVSVGVSGVRKKFLTNEERKAVLQAILARCDEKLNLEHGTLTEVGEEFGRSRQTISAIWTQAKASIANGGTAMNVDNRRSNCGRKKIDRTAVLAAIHTIPNLQRQTYRSTSHRIGIPKSSLWEMCQARSEDGPQRHLVIRKPTLTEQHKEARIDYCISNIDGEFFKDGFDTVHVDEKWFNLFKAQYSCILGPGEAPPYASCRHKRYIDKAMFLTAVARPRRCSTTNSNFDGKIGCFPLVKMVEAKRTSRNRPAGTLEMKSLRAKFISGRVL
mmetsp:Transcript_7048/g.17356  ORF Transcript_7048/g.17356 Transcript_7048/m.17356 type:complete len:289 (+) Transcript_7048:37-903(+)